MLKTKFTTYFLNFFYISFLALGPYLLTRFINHDKEVYIVSIFYYFLLISSSRFLDKPTLDVFRKLNNVLNKVDLKIYIFLIFIILIINQNKHLNYETISWDTASYLVASMPIGDGYLPLEKQWDSKGPLFFYIYYFLTFLSNNSLVYFKIFNDLVLFLICLNLYKTMNLLNKDNKFISFIFTTLFLTITAKTDLVPEYSEYYVLLIISWIFVRYIRYKFDNNNLYIIPFLISLCFLINQSAAIFLIPYIFLYLRNSKFKINDITKTLIGFFIPQLFVHFIYYINGYYDLLLINYYYVPFGYSEVGNASSLNELRIWFREYFHFNKFTYFSIITVVYFQLQRILESYKEKNISHEINLLSLHIIVSLSIYFLGGHNYAHHLIYFVYFMVLILGKLKLNNFLVLLFLIITLSSSSVFIKSFNQSFNNLTNLRNVQENYPIYQLAENIKERQVDNNYSVLALEYVLILYYLDKENYSYIVHPTNHFEEYITKPLYRFGYIENNQIDNLLKEEPDIILCNSMRIHEGSPIINENFDCSKENFKNYYQIDTSSIRKDRKIEYFFDPYKELNVFVKNK